jgi:hypothetical protein
LNFELNILLQWSKLGKSRSIPLASILVANARRKKSKEMDKPRREVDLYRQDHFRGNLVVHFQLVVFILAWFITRFTTPSTPRWVLESASQWDEEEITARSASSVCFVSITLSISL